MDRQRKLLLAGVMLGGLGAAAPAWTDDRQTASAAEGAADARTDFSHGVLMLLGGEGMVAGGHVIGGGLTVEIVPHACAPDLGPAAYVEAYNRIMKAGIREKHGIDIDALPPSAFSGARE